MERDQAFARLATVAGAELLAGVICWLPLLLAPDAAWRAECRSIAVLTTIGALAVISVAFVVPWIWEWGFGHLKYVAEIVSVTIFTIDLVALILAILSTGGTSDSFYAPLLSVLITLVLLFELQKEMIGGPKSRMIWFYAGAVFVVWAGAASFSYDNDLTGAKALIPRDVTRCGRARLRCWGLLLLLPHMSCRRRIGLRVS